MGNIIDNQTNPVTKLENTNSAKEKDDISKGTFADRYEVDKRDSRNFYDYIININTFSQKPNIIWTIENKAEMKNIPFQEKDKDKEKEKEKNKENKFEENEENENITKNEEPNVQDEKNNEINDKINNDEVDKTTIGILGLGNVGKSYLLSFFTGQELPTGNSIHTKGISFKKVDNFIILDSEGIEAPLTKKNISKELYPKESLLKKSINESDSLIETIARDKKAVELFIQDFIIEKSDILVIVVGQLILTEQKLINRIVNSVQKKQIFVIHNLKDLCGKQQILDYINNTFKKNIFFIKNKKLTEQSYKKKSDLINKEEEYNKYFLEIYQNIDGSKKEVLHFIMGSNVKDSEAYYFNKTVKDYFQDEIRIFAEGKKFNVFNELKEFIVKRGKNYVEQIEGSRKPFTLEDIKIEKKGDINCIIINNQNNRIKKCIMNQLGYSHFYGALYSPNFVAYVEEDKENKTKKLIIDISAPGNGFVFDKAKKEEISEDGHKIKISFTGTKKLREYNECEEIFSNMDSGNFRIDIVLDYNKYRIKELNEARKKNIKGIMRFTLPLIPDEELKADVKMKVVAASGKTKGKGGKEGKEEKEGKEGKEGKEAKEGKEKKSKNKK